MNFYSKSRRSGRLENEVSDSGYCDETFIVPSDDTGRIQEVHITAGHALMEYIEDQLIELNYLHLQE